MDYRDSFRGKSVLVTGGTGSFGQYIVRELLKFDVAKVVVFSRDEEKQLDMSRKFADHRLSFVIGDVRDRERVMEVVKADYVYHAAALKIIPTCELNPTEAYKTNLVGSMNVREACIWNNVRKAILISTDKAVKPVNTYGMTKALSERIWLSKVDARSQFTVVRYGNVLGSRGSIVPLFKQLVAEKEPLPITDRSMSRFLLSLKDAIELVFYATLSDTNECILVRKSPACRVTDLARALVSSSYPLVDVGVRPGEKIAEILVSEEEVRRAEEREEYFIVHPHDKYSSNLSKEYSSDTAKQLNPSEIKILLEESGL